MEDKIKSVLQNEEMMAKIAEMIKGIAPAVGGSPASQADTPPAAPAFSEVSAEAAPPPIPAPPQREPSIAAASNALSALGGKNHAAALLSSLRPFLRESRKSKLDTLATAISMAGVFKSMKSGG